jgi:hypothetical protein
LAWKKFLLDGDSAASDYPKKLKPALTRYVLPGWACYNASNVTVTAGRIYYIPIFVTETTTYTAIGISVIGTATGSCDLRIFQWNNGVPGALILSAGTVDTGTNGAKEIAISQTLDRGYYFLAGRCNAAPTLSCPYSTYYISLPIGGFQTSLSFALNTIMIVDAAYADPAPAPTGVVGDQYAFILLKET